MCDRRQQTHNNNNNNNNNITQKMICITYMQKRKEEGRGLLKTEATYRAEVIKN